MSPRLGKGFVAITVGAALVAGCASGPRKPSARALQQIDRALAKAPGKAQPSVIVKTELALNRMAREEGQVDAYKAFAAPGAKIHSEAGILDAETVFAKFKNPAKTSQFETKWVFMSCDGSVAVSQGRGRDPDGKVGNYIFVWERQPGISTRGDEDETGYRYVYFTAAADEPQPPPRPVITPGPDDIVVEALDSVRADIATCAPRDEIALKAYPQPLGGQLGSGSSRDKTLQWNWYSVSAGTRRVTVDLWRKDGAETVFTLGLPSAP